VPRKSTRSNVLRQTSARSPGPLTAAVIPPAAGTEPATRPLPGERTGANARARIATILAVGGLLALHYALAAHSMLQENPTVDEVVHMPAGITYWQKGTFRLYHHNPPLVKLVAALPVVWANPVTEPLYQMPSWKTPDPSQTTFSQTFARMNVARYFELFQLARIMMPLFSIIGGLVVFAWSRRLYGTWGGLLSLSLWVFCPNILAHARLVTSDVGATALGVAATYVFWRYLYQPNWRWAAAAGVILGLAQLTKFTMLLLYAVWPILWLARLVLLSPRSEWQARILRALGHGLVMVVLSIVTIDAGYFCEGLGIPLGKFEFASKSLTRPVTADMKRPHSMNELLDVTWQFRVNRFRGTWLGSIPCPLPEHYLLGFDEQKIETEGIPVRLWKAVRTNQVAGALAVPESPDEEKTGYSVYLNGELRRTGWWYFYFVTLFYKLPEGTLILAVLSLLSLRFVRHSRAEWFDEIAIWTVPVVILFSMSFLTDINLGLRYVLAVLPYVFIATGRLVPFVQSRSRARKWVITGLVVAALTQTIVATIGIHPHYLSFFNWASGGPDRSPARLIDSNLDWGQDLVALQKWWKKTIPGQPIGLAYFGQINPSIFKLRGEDFDWFLPPVMPGTTRAIAENPSPLLVGPAKKLTPGYYAVSATLVHGLPWRLYDPASPVVVPGAWAPAWNASEVDAFWYFRQFEPITRIGHSIYVYHLSADDVAGAEPLFMAHKRHIENP
jgi:Dolichyl-phosphate-mannose-protein mannosyltransferase